VRLTEEQYAKLRYARNNPDLVGAPPAPRPSKYRSIMEECDNIEFQSKKEARYYRELKARVYAGEVKYFLRQVPFELFGVKYRVDFMEVLKDGQIRYVDVKGFRTATYKAKRKQVMNLYPVVIEEA
jgi:hypothetical protein